MIWLPKHTVTAGVGLIVVVNAIVLAGVAYNRSAEPESALRFSERELSAPMREYGNKENSGLALTMNWRVLPPGSEGPKKGEWPYASNGGSPNWLNQAKMLALGFEKSAVSQTAYGESRIWQPLPRDVLLVLEFDGPAHKTALARAVQFSEVASTEEKTRAIDALKREQSENSRLFVVDAGLDVAALRDQHPDRNRYAIVHGQVRANSAIDRDAAAPAGFISGVSPDSLNVPLDWRHVFDGASPVRRDGQVRVRYAVEVKFGQRLEPWISQATRVAASASQ